MRDTDTGGISINKSFRSSKINDNISLAGSFICADINITILEATVSRKIYCSGRNNAVVTSIDQIRIRRKTIIAACRIDKIRIISPGGIGARIFRLQCDISAASSTPAFYCGICDGNRCIVYNLSLIRRGISPENGVGNGTDLNMDSASVIDRRIFSNGTVDNRKRRGFKCSCLRLPDCSSYASRILCRAVYCLISIKQRIFCTARGGILYIEGSSAATRIVEKCTVGNRKCAVRTRTESPAIIIAIGKTGINNSIVVPENRIGDQSRHCLKIHGASPCRPILFKNRVINLD